MPVALRDGFYAVRHGADYRLLRLLTVAEGIDKKDATYRRIFYYKAGNSWKSFAFLNDDGRIHIYLKYEKTWTQQQLASIREALAAIRTNPHEALWLYKQITK